MGASLCAPIKARARGAHPEAGALALPKLVQRRTWPSPAHCGCEALGESSEVGGGHKESGLR